MERAASAANAIYIVFRKPGPTWVKGLGSRQQPRWDEHAAFMDRLYDQGRVLLGGPYSDYSRVMQIVRAANEAGAQTLFDDDPWTEMKLLLPDGVQRWSIFLGPTAWREPT